MRFKRVEGASMDEMTIWQKINILELASRRGLWEARKAR